MLSRSVPAHGVRPRHDEAHGLDVAGAGHGEVRPLVQELRLHAYVFSNSELERIFLTLTFS